MSQGMREGFNSLELAGFPFVLPLHIVFVASMGYVDGRRGREYNP